MQPFVIHGTGSGPIVQFENRTFGLREQQELIDVAERCPGFIEAMNHHLMSTLIELTQDYIEAFGRRYALPKAHLQAYVDAMDQFLSWEQFVWASYNDSLRKTLGGH